MNIRLDMSGKTLRKAAWVLSGKWDSEGELSVSGRQLTVGLGKKDRLSRQKIRRAAAKGLAQAKTLKAKEVAVDLDSFGDTFAIDEVLTAVVEGARLSTYRFDKYRSKPSNASSLSGIILCTQGSKRNQTLGRVLRDTLTVMDAVDLTRDIANEPANVMTPLQVAQVARATAAKNGLICRILQKKEMRRLGMGGVLAVSQGSSFLPQFIVLENKVKAKGDPIVLVGKGITFDTGGISLKPSGDMDKMKFDMCGAAAVIGAMKAIANLKLPVKVIGLAPVCENMPGSTAQRPGDIIRCMNGKTVEVLNTDAEGRLILADALSYAKRFNPRALVDMATLTGACAATFGELAIGLMGTDEDLVQRLRQAGETTGERCWQLPLWEEYSELIRATNADLQNISKKNAGTITAGMFLKEFAEHTPQWAHLDIAGTAWTNAGATGVGVRLFVELVKSYL